MANEGGDDVWFDDYSEDESEFEIAEYEVTATPNDFNVSTIFNFIESGAVVIPGFQRNYVWDRARASKLIESLLLGLPVPQVFLYEEARNKFLVIDGQQRLMSIYYFIKQRFPRKEKRAELRLIFERNGRMPDEVIHSDDYFDNFSLQLPSKLPNKENKFNGEKYSTLGDYKVQLDLRPVRNVIVRQGSGDGDDSAVYEIFNRLNSGGINLTPQEIRLSLYHSQFYDMLLRLNSESRWRKILQMPTPDLHMKDVEVLLRAFAMLIDRDQYAPSMVRFLNQFSKKGQSHSKNQNRYLADLFCAFLLCCDDLPGEAFFNPKNRRFSIALFEAVFTAACSRRFAQREFPRNSLPAEPVGHLANDPEFQAAAQYGTTQTSNVKKRLERAFALIPPL